MVKLDQRIDIPRVYQQQALKEVPIVQLFAFVDLTRFTGFDIISEIFSLIFPIHRSLQSFFQAGVAWVLQIVVIPSYCMVLKGFWYNHFTVFAEHTCIFNKSFLKFTGNFLLLQIFVFDLFFCNFIDC